jgi:hypothetical protein
MRRLAVLASPLAVMRAFGYVSLKHVEGKVTEQPSSDRQTRAVVDATTAFLAPLNIDQRQKVQFASRGKRLARTLHSITLHGAAPQHTLWEKMAVRTIASKGLSWASSSHRREWVVIRPSMSTPSIVTQRMTMA